MWLIPLPKSNSLFTSTVVVSVALLQGNFPSGSSLRRTACVEGLARWILTFFLKHSTPVLCSDVELFGGIFCEHALLEWEEIFTEEWGNIHPMGVEVGKVILSRSTVSLKGCCRSQEKANNEPRDT